MSIKLRGVRGATTVERDNKDEILQATDILFKKIIELNDIKAEDVASVFITTTADLTSTFPAISIRLIDGWTLVPVMCSTEISVPGSLPKCIRIMLHLNTTKSQQEIKHVYLENAVRLRPDLSLTSNQT